MTKRICRTREEELAMPPFKQHQKHQLVTGVFLLLALASCSDSAGPPEDTTPNFAIYLPAEPDIKVSDWFGNDLDSLDISNTPWITDDDLLMYDFSSHMMYLKETRSDFLEYSAANPGVFLHSWCDRPFLVVANGTRAYPGYFGCSFSSSMYILPEIGDLSDGLLPEVAMRLQWTWLFHDDNDQRQDDRVRSALIDAGVYHAGISIKLDAMTVLEDGEYSSVEYTFTVTNNDVDALYLLDPEIVGDSVYHQWTNGVALYSTDSGTYHQRLHLGVGAESPEWNQQWYTLVPSGGAMTRHTVVQHFEPLIPGEYLAVLTYTAPATVPANQIQQGASRYWLGHMFSEVVGITIDSLPGAAHPLTVVSHAQRQRFPLSFLQVNH